MRKYGDNVVATYLWRGGEGEEGRDEGRVNGGQRGLGYLHKVISGLGYTYI